jgi:hypothetical protein
VVKKPVLLIPGNNFLPTKEGTLALKCSCKLLTSVANSRQHLCVQWKEKNFVKKYNRNVDPAAKVTQGVFFWLEARKLKENRKKVNQP